MITITDKTAPYIFKTGNIPPNLEAAIGRYIAKKHGVAYFGKNAKQNPESSKKGLLGSVQLSELIHSLIRISGPMTAGEVADAANISRQLSSNSLIRLESTGFVFCAGKVRRNKKSAVKLYQNAIGESTPARKYDGIKLQTIELLTKNGPLSVRELVNLGGRSVQGYKHAAKALIKDGLIKIIKKPKGNITRDKLFYAVVK